MTDVDLWGNAVPLEARQRRCGHLNATYKLPLQGMVTLRSTYAPGVDRVEEVERALHWQGGIQGRCDDCGKQLWYGYSSIPKFIWRRLRRAVVPGPKGENLLERDNY